jgi:hypothetical protein
LTPALTIRKVSIEAATDADGATSVGAGAIGVSVSAPHPVAITAITMEVRAPSRWMRMPTPSEVWRLSGVAMWLERLGPAARISVDQCEENGVAVRKLR